MLLKVTWFLLKLRQLQDQTKMFLLKHRALSLEHRPISLKPRQLQDLGKRFLVKATLIPLKLRTFWVEHRLSRKLLEKTNILKCVQPQLDMK